MQKNNNNKNILKLSCLYFQNYTYSYDNIKQFQTNHERYWQ